MNIKALLKKLFDSFKENQKPVAIEEIVVTAAKLLHKSVKEIISLDKTITEQQALDRINKAYTDGH